MLLVASVFSVLKSLTWVSFPMFDHSCGLEMKLCEQSASLCQLPKSNTSPMLQIMVSAKSLLRLEVVPWDILEDPPHGTEAYTTACCTLNRVLHGVGQGRISDLLPYGALQRSLSMQMDSGMACWVCHVHVMWIPCVICPFDLNKNKTKGTP